MKNQNKTYVYLRGIPDALLHMSVASVMKSIIL